MPVELLSVLSCRDASGYGLASQVNFIVGPNNLQGEDSFLLLIHGYNDRQVFAAWAYSLFLAQMDASLSTLQTIKVVELHWPADKPNVVESAADFAGSITNGLGTAALLASFLNDLASKLAPAGKQLQVDIVAHSLGNRITLETIKRLNPGVRVNSFVLMAAAVNVKDVDTGAGLHASAVMPNRTTVFHSTSDMVLAIAAPAGETLAGEGFFPQAVGRHGKPFHVVWQYESSFDGFGHSDYWPGQKSAATAAAAIGLTVQNSLVAACIADYKLPAPNSIATASIPTRQIPAQAVD